MFLRSIVLGNLNDPLGIRGKSHSARGISNSSGSSTSTKSPLTALSGRSAASIVAARNSGMIEFLRVGGPKTVPILPVRIRLENDIVAVRWCVGDWEGDIDVGEVERLRNGRSSTNREACDVDVVCLLAGGRRLASLFIRCMKKLDGGGDITLLTLALVN